MRTHMTYVAHTISQIPDCGATWQIYCLAPGCGTTSGPQPEETGASGWALHHTAATGHDAFRRHCTDFAHVARDQ